MKYLVKSMVIIETVVDLADDQDDIFEAAGDEAGNKIAQILIDANVEFDFCDEYTVFDFDGNEIEEAA